MGPPGGGTEQELEENLELDACFLPRSISPQLTASLVPLSGHWCGVVVPWSFLFEWCEMSSPRMPITSGKPPCRKSILRFLRNQPPIVNSPTSPTIGESIQVVFRLTVVRMSIVKSSFNVHSMAKQNEGLSWESLSTPIPDGLESS